MQDCRLSSDINQLQQTFPRILDSKVWASPSFRLGIMGGTFDPIHMGHLACAQAVLDLDQVDAVLFIPTGHPSFKEGKKVTPGPVRFRMVEMALADHPGFFCTPLEVEREGATYTVDTLEQLQDRYPDARLFFILGEDSLRELYRWRDAHRLADMATFLCVDRQGYEPRTEGLDDFDIRLIDVTTPDISSTRIREMVGRGESIEGLVPPLVAQFIYEQGLYRDDEVAEGVDHG